MKAQGCLVYLLVPLVDFYGKFGNTSWQVLCEFHGV